MAMPRLPATLVHAPPFSLRRSSPVSNFDGGVSNPGLPANAGDGTIDFGSAYPGFSNVVDLQARGRLSDQIAFRVRASQPALWRAEAFDTYDGMRWTESDKTTEPLIAGWDGISSQVPPDIARGDQTMVSINHVVQTFYIDTPQPNVLFAAASVSQVYFPSGGLRADSSGSIRSPILLDQGLTYSVISEVPILIPRELREFAGTKVPKGMQNYLELPTTLPSRVGDLATQIAAAQPTEFDRVEAVQAWLRANTKYNLDVPRDPPGVDAVDQFLFVTRQGFCEHIASAMAVMLRTLGIPTRLVTGYGPGERNPLTGYLEVKESDAHAWVEVYYPRLGWVPYDPTFGVPDANPNALSRFMAGPALVAIGRFVRGVVPASVKRAVGAFGRAGARVLRMWQVVVGLAVAALIVLGLVMLRRKRKRAGHRLRGVEAAFAELAEALAPTGHVRRDTETPSEFLLGIRRDRSLDEGILMAAEFVVRTFERDRFAPSKPSDADVMRARAEAARARDLVGKR
jgi:transglutaminase-like putative cysteine protease